MKEYGRWLLDNVTQRSVPEVAVAVESPTTTWRLRSDGLYERDDWPAFGRVAIITDNPTKHEGNV